jgi:hypothetical protein
MNAAVLVHSEEPAAYYARSLGEASKSGLDKVAQSPAHYRAWILGQEEPETPALRFGRAFHMAILEPQRFRTVYITAPDFSVYGHPNSNAHRDAKRAWFAEHEGNEIIGRAEAETIERMRDAVMAHPIARNLVIGGTPEATLRWTDPRTGLRCKARADYHLPDLRAAVDVKSTDNAHPATFARSVAAYRYHVQDAFYREGFAQAGSPIDRFLFLNVEKEPPHLVSVTYCDDAALERGGQLVDRDLATLARCVERNEWPGYPEELVPMQLPAWAFYD